MISKKLKNPQSWTMIRIKEGTKHKLKVKKEGYFSNFDAYINYLIKLDKNGE